MGIHSRDDRQAKIMPAVSVRRVNPTVSVSWNKVHWYTLPFNTPPTMLMMRPNMRNEATVLHVSRTLGCLRLHDTSSAARNAVPTARKGLGSFTIISGTPPVTLV